MIVDNSDINMDNKCHVKIVAQAFDRGSVR